MGGDSVWSCSCTIPRQVPVIPSRNFFYPRTHLKVLVIDATRIYQQIYLRPLLDQRGRACFQPSTHNILLPLEKRKIIRALHS